MPSAYLIADADITDPEQYAEYRKLSTAAMQAHRAEVCVRGEEIEVLEGDWNPRRVVILKFPSMDAARAFWNSREYALARQAREGAAHMRIVLAKGT